MPKKHNAGGCCGCDTPPCGLCNATEYKKNLRVQLSIGYPTPCEWDFEIDCYPNTVVVENVISQSYTHLKKTVVSVQPSRSALDGGEIILVTFHQQHLRYDIVNAFGISLSQLETVQFAFRPSADDGCAHNRYAYFPCTLTQNADCYTNNSVTWTGNPLGFPPLWDLQHEIYNISGGMLGWPDPPLCLSADFDSSLNLVANHVSCTLSWV